MLKVRMFATTFCLVATAALADDSNKSASPEKKAESRISSSVVAHPTKSLTHEEANQVSFAAGRVLKHVVQAREAIHESKKEVAIKHADQGLKLLAIIDGVLPQFKVTAEIKTANQTYSDEEEVKSRYVTIFDELERRDVISPVAQAKSQDAQKSNKNGTEVDKANESHPAFAVSHVDVNHSAVKLDLVTFKQMLARAKGLLGDGRLDDADHALRTALSRGVLFEYEEVDLPLEEAADNLKLAEAEMLQGKVAEAKAALHVAIDQLQQYEKRVGDHRSAEVKALHQEITKLTKELETAMPSEADRKKFAGQISGWWSGVTKWFKSRTK